MALTRNQLDTYVDANVTDKTAVDSLTPTDEGNSIKKVADYADDNFVSLNKTYGIVNSTGTPTELTNSTNDLTGANAVYYLPENLPIGTAITVMANDSIPAVIQGNLANQTVIKTSRVSDTISSVTIVKYQTVKFTKLYSSFWLFETVDAKEYLSYTALLTQASTSIPTAVELTNEIPFGTTLTITRSGAGQYYFDTSANFFTTNKATIIIGSLANPTYSARAVINSQTQALVLTYISNIASDDVLSNTFFEIRVYN